MTDRKTAQLIAAHQVPTMVDAAIKQAKLTTTGPIVKRWDTIGYILRDAALAVKFSHDVAAQLNKGGHAVVPSTLTIDGHILAGFIERDAIPALRQF